MANSQKTPGQIAKARNFP